MRMNVCIMFLTSALNGDLSDLRVCVVGANGRNYISVG
jgi:hypothetical protein